MWPPLVAADTGDPTWVVNSPRRIRQVQPGPKFSLSVRSQTGRHRLLANCIIVNEATSGRTIGWLNKVPDITLAFWVIKILSTAVGETGADFLAVNAGWGQGPTCAVMATLLTMALTAQLRTHRYTPWAYWLTVVLVSVVGTQVTDLLTDGLDVSLYLSTAVFALALAATFAVWYWSRPRPTEAWTWAPCGPAHCSSP